MKTASAARATLTAALMMVWSAQAAAEGIYDSIAETSTTPPAMQSSGNWTPDFGVAELDGAVHDYQTQPGPPHEKAGKPVVTQTTGFGVAVLDESIHDYGIGS